jgi:CubicO group peptidase (beta-lactamase class C family)
MPDQPETRLQRRALDRAFEVAATQVADGAAPFVVLGVADSRGVIRLEAVTSERAPGVGTSSICLLASITKPIVATTVLQLVEAGRFPLDVPLGTWLPELERPGRLPFTAWHVLSHTTGMDDFDLEELLEARGKREELLRVAAGLMQDATPGSRYHYTSFTFDLLAEAVGRAIGTPFETLLADGVLGPLGMTDTTFDPRPDRADRTAPVAFARGEDARRAAAHELEHGWTITDAFTDLHLAGGGLWSTAADLLRFGRAMLRGGELDGVRVLSPAFVALATREVTVNGIGASPDRQRDDHYALGWGKPGVASPGSASAFGHGGASGTRLWIDPAYDLAYVYLSGDWGLPTQPIDAVASAIYAAHPGIGW